MDDMAKSAAPRDRRGTILISGWPCYVLEREVRGNGPWWNLRDRKGEDRSGVSRIVKFLAESGLGPSRRRG